MSTKVVIIGAGIAGLAAASHFCEENFDEFIILEVNENRYSKLGFFILFNLQIKGK